MWDKALIRAFIENDPRARRVFVRTRICAHTRVMTSFDLFPFLPCHAFLFLLNYCRTSYFLPNASDLATYTFRWLYLFLFLQYIFLLAHALNTFVYIHLFTSSFITRNQQNNYSQYCTCRASPSLFLFICLSIGQRAGIFCCCVFSPCQCL